MGQLKNRAATDNQPNAGETYKIRPLENQSKTEAGRAITTAKQKQN